MLNLILETSERISSKMKIFLITVYFSMAPLVTAVENAGRSLKRKK